MSSQKRPGPFEDSDEEIPSSSRSSASKRRRISDVSAIPSSPPSDGGRQSPPSTPPSDMDSDEDVDDIEHTQAVDNIRPEDNQPAEYGILEAVHVVNFMCHKNEKWELSPLINFMCGRNGSGKSAILTAIVICLGGKAAGTGRGSALKDFIRHGSEHGSVTCYLKNQGQNAYRNDVYGDTIIVERHFNKNNSSSFKIRNAGGKAIISTKKGDLDDILDHYCLQIDNPLNVLSQDAARMFMAGSKPSEKYKFFLKGVLLEQLDQDYKLIEENVDNMTPKIRQCQEDIAETKRRWQVAERKVTESRKLNDSRDRLDVLRHLCIWAQVEHVEAIRDKCVEAVDEGKAAIARAEEEKEALELKVDEARLVVNEKNEIYETEKTKIEEVKSAKEKVADEVKDANDALSTTHAETRLIMDDLKQSRAGVKEKQRQIREEEARLAEVDEGGAARRVQQLRNLEDAAKEAKTRYEERQNAKAEILQNGNDSKKTKAEAEEKLKEQERHVKELKAGLQKIQKSDSNLAGFRPGMDRLIQAVQRETRFRDRPIGPLAMHLKLADQKWAHVIEKQLGRSGGGFVCTNKADQDILFELGRKCGIDPCPIIPPTRHIDISSQEPDERFLTILRALEIDHPLIRNALILHGGLDSAILVEDFDEAQRIINEERPHNVKSCFTFMPQNRGKAVRLFYSQNTPAQDPVDDWAGPLRVKSNIDEQIRFHQQNIADEESRLAQYHTEAKDCDSAYKAAIKDYKEYQAEVGRLQIAHQQAGQAVEDKTNEVEQDETASNLGPLKESLAEFEKEVETKAALYGDAVNAEDQSKKAVREAEQALATAERRRRQAQASAEKIKLEAQEADKQLKLHSTKYADSMNRIHDGRTRLQEYENQMRGAEAQVEEYLGEARKAESERVPIPEGESFESLDKKFEKLKESIDSASTRIGGDPVELERKRAEALEAYNGVKKGLEAMSALRNHLSSSWMERVRRWKFFRQMIGWRARSRFIYLLSERGFRGKLIMDHVQHQLDLLVEPDITKRDGSGRSARTLSGGEKSFAQICLLLALWEAMGSPLRCLDEFDVFMDAVNRNMSVNLLIHAARQSQGRQYIMISPGTKSDIKPAPDVHAFEVAPPERGQQRLSFQRAEAA